MRKNHHLITVFIVLIALLSACETPAPNSQTSTDTPAAPVSSVTPISVDSAGSIRCLRKLTAHDPQVYGLDFSPDGSLLGAYTLDGVVQVWDRTSWQVLQEFQTTTVYGWRLFFLADGQQISSGDGTVWDLDSGEQVHSLGAGHTVAFSPDGVYVASIERGGPVIEVRRVKDWGVEREITAVSADMIFTLAFSPDSRLLASDAIKIRGETMEHTIRLWDVTSGEELFSLEGHQDTIHRLVFSPHGRWLVSGSMDTTVKIWDVQTGQLVHTFQTGGELFDLAVSPDSNLVAAALNNSTVELWDIASERRLRILNHEAEVVSVTFSPDGALLASGAYDGKIYLWGE